MSGPLFYDRVMETSTTTGTGTYTLAGAVTGYQAFSVVGNSNTCRYVAWDSDSNGNPLGGWEVGTGTYTLSGTTLARTSVLASSNSGSAVNWAAGTRRLALVYDASAVTLAGSATTSLLTMNTARVLGRTAASSGAIQELSGVPVQVVNTETGAAT